MRTSIKRSALALLLVSILLTQACDPELLSLDDIKSNKVWLNDFIDHHYVFSVFLFFLACVILINSPVPFAALAKVLSGFFFGFYLGAIYNIAASILACLTGFAISRYAFRNAFEKAYYQRLQAIETEIEKNGFYYFLTLRLVMVVPYFLINITAGISRVSFKSYLFSTLLGVMPTSLIYANGGNQLEQLDSIADLFNPEVLVSLTLVALLSSLPMVLKKLKP